MTEVASVPLWINFGTLQWDVYLWWLHYVSHLIRYITCLGMAVLGTPWKFNVLTLQGFIWSLCGLYKCVVNVCSQIRNHRHSRCKNKEPLSNNIGIFTVTVGHITLVAIIWTSVMVPYLKVKSLLLIWRFSHRCNIRMQILNDLQRLGYMTW